jgi:hypothetical protein
VAVVLIGNLIEHSAVAASLNAVDHGWKVHIAGEPITRIAVEAASAWFERVFDLRCR